MAITIEHTSGASAVLTVQVSKADYQPAVDKALNNYRQRANIPGFRPGKAPKSIIQKQFGMGAKLEEINRYVSNSIYEYITSEKLRVLGEPMPLADLGSKNDYEQGEEFEFLFEVALAPKFDFQLGKEDKLTYYQIEASDDMVSAHIEQVLNQHGTQVEVDTVEDNDLVRGTLAELEGDQPKEGGVRNEKAMLLPRYIKSEAVRAQFVGATKNSVIVFEPFAAYEGNEAELVSFLTIDKDQVAKYEGVSFSFEIESISRHEPATLGEEFYNAVFGEQGDVKDEATFRAKVREGFREQFDPESDYKFLSDLRQVVINKAGKVEYAEELLKNWLVSKNEGMTQEQATEQMPKMLEDLTYQIYKDDLLAEHKVSVERAEVLEFAKVVAKSQFAQYGMSSVPDELLDNYANSLVGKEDTYRNFASRVLDNKFAAIVKDLVTVETKVVSVEEFGKMVNPEAEA